jgi:hypothetical protein
LFLSWQIAPLGARCFDGSQRHVAPAAAAPEKRETVSAGRLRRIKSRSAARDYGYSRNARRARWFEVLAESMFRAT